MEHEAALPMPSNRNR